MAKKTDRAIRDLAKEVKKLRKQNEKLSEALERTREDQAAAHRELRELLEERPAARDAGPDGTAEVQEADRRAEEASDPATDPQEAQEEPEFTDAAKRRAKELGVDPSDVKGTGSGGRVLVKDVEAAAGR